MNPAWIGFLVIALVMLTSALQVVRSRDLVHSVFWLALTLLTTAALFVHLHADFIAAVQVLLYTGGVVTLMLFGIMLTRRLDGIRIPNISHRVGLGAVLSGAVFVTIGLAIMRDPVSERVARGLSTPDTEALGRVFLQDLVLPFEVLSLLLLAAMVGAIALARKVDP
jgi:NADH:ubiquinone oxidoreductase subunit 6 (subunit J)